MQNSLDTWKVKCMWTFLLPPLTCAARCEIETLGKKTPPAHRTLLDVERAGFASYSQWSLKSELWVCRSYETKALTSVTKWNSFGFFFNGRSVFLTCFHEAGKQEEQVRKEEDFFFFPLRKHFWLQIKSKSIFRSVVLLQHIVVLHTKGRADL